jgi:hypothetical protein
MPFTIKKEAGKYKLYNSSKKVYVKKTFISRESAIKSGLNYMRYRGEIGIVKGNRILVK